MLIHGGGESKAAADASAEPAMWSPLGLEAADTAAGPGRQFGGRHFEDRVRCAGGGPNRLESAQALVDKRGDGLGVTDGRHTADGKSRSAADKIRVGLGDRFGEGSFNLVFADAIASAGDDQNGSVRGAAAKNDRFSDLFDIASDGGSGFRGGSGGGRKLGDFASRTQPFEALLDSLQSTGILGHSMNIQTGSGFRRGL